MDFTMHATDRPKRPSIATARKLYAELDAAHDTITTLKADNARLGAEFNQLLIADSRHLVDLTALRGRVEIAEQAKAQAEAHAANLFEGNARLAADLNNAEQSRDALQTERDQLLHSIEADDRANLLGTLGFAFIIGLIAWLVRGFVR